MTENSRYPYTYAADFMRMALVTHDFSAACPLSRSQAAQIRQAVARALGMSDAALAELLATQYLLENPQ